MSKIGAATGSLRYYGHVVVGEREIRIVSIRTRWIHKSEPGARWKSANRFDLHPFRNDSGSHSLRTLISSRMLKLSHHRSYVSNFLYRFHLLRVYTSTRIQLSSLCSPGLTSTSAFDDIPRRRKESSSDGTCPP